MENEQIVHSVPNVVGTIREPFIDLYDDTKKCIVTYLPSGITETCPRHRWNAHPINNTFTLYEVILNDILLGRDSTNYHNYDYFQNFRFKDAHRITTFTTFDIQNPFGEEIEPVLEKLHSDIYTRLNAENKKWTSNNKINYQLIQRLLLIEKDFEGVITHSVTMKRIHIKVTIQIEVKRRLSPEKVIHSPNTYSMRLDVS
jgi:hypothetical protein